MARASSERRTTRCRTGRRRSASGRGRGSGRPARSTTSELLAEGDRRNVVDRYRYWSLEADRGRPRHPAARLPRGDRELAARLQHRHDRPHRQRLPGRARCTSSATAAGTVAGRWSPTATSTSGTTPDVESLAAYVHERDVQLMGVDNLPGSEHLETWEMPRQVCFLFGQEGPGLSEQAREAVRRHVLDRAVRLDALDQRLGGRCDRDAHVGGASCRPRRAPGAAERVRARPVVQGLGVGCGGIGPRQRTNLSSAAQPSRLGTWKNPPKPFSSSWQRSRATCVLTPG